MLGLKKKLVCKNSIMLGLKNILVCKNSIMLGLKNILVCSCGALVPAVSGAAVLVPGAVVSSAVLVIGVPPNIIQNNVSLIR